MDVRDAMKKGLSTLKEWGDKLLEDISEEDSMVRGRDGLNHIKWLAGHLCDGTRMIASGLGNEPDFDERERYAMLFEWGTAPLDEAELYPRLGEIRKRHDKFHAAALEAIDKLSDDELEKEIEVTDDWKVKTVDFVVGFECMLRFEHPEQPLRRLVCRIDLRGSPGIL